MIIEEILDQPIFLNCLNKFGFSSVNPYFYSSQREVIANKFTIIKDMCRFFQPGFISYKRVEENLGYTRLITKRYIMDLIPNEWKHKLEAGLLKNLSSTFCFGSKGIRKTKDF